MGGRHLPQSYVETGRFGLSVPIALLILGSLLGGPDDSDVTIGGRTFTLRFRLVV